MPSIFDYIKKYDVSFLEKSFTEIDNIIFSRFSYLKFDNILSFNDKISIKNLYKKYTSMNIKTDYNTYDLFKVMATSKRFSSLIVGNYYSIIDDSLEKQFSAITIFLPGNLLYISFRGTDNTLIGIKEDFNMTYMINIPSQFESVNYLEKVLSNNSYFAIVGGHSKGGNLAMYSSIFCKKKYQERIIKIYNNDGPGFFNEIVTNPKYEKNLDKIITFVPETSIIGMLLNHKEEFIAVKSRKSLILQHDLFSWEIDDDKLIRVKSVNRKSKYIDDIMTSLLNISIEERKKFFDIIYQILISTGVSSIDDLTKEKIKNVKIFINSYKKLSNGEKEFFIKIWKKIVVVATNNIKTYLIVRKKKTPS